MAYRWRTLAFEAPKGRDESAVLLVDEADPPNWNLNLRLDDLPGGPASFAAYCAGQHPPIGVNVDKSEEKTIAGRPALIRDQRLKLEDGAVLRQQQALIRDGSSVIVVTMTARSVAHKMAKDAFDKLLGSLEFGDPP